MHQPSGVRGEISQMLNRRALSEAAVLFANSATFYLRRVEQALAIGGGGSINVPGAEVRVCAPQHQAGYVRCGSGDP